MPRRLVRLYPKWARVAAAESPLAYVRRALVNGFVSRRRRTVSRELPLRDLPEAPDAADVAEAVSTRRTLITLVGGLPDRQRAASRTICAPRCSTPNRLPTNRRTSPNG